MEQRQQEQQQQQNTDAQQPNQERTRVIKRKENSSDINLQFPKSGETAHEKPDGSNRDQVSKTTRKQPSSFNILKSGQKRPSANAINSEVIAKGNSEIRLSGDQSKMRGIPKKVVERSMTPLRQKGKFTEVSSSSSSSASSMIRGARNQGDMESEDDNEEEYFESSSSSQSSQRSDNSLLNLNDHQRGAYDGNQILSLDSESQELVGAVKGFRGAHFPSQKTGGNVMNEKLHFQLNSEELHRQELGGVVVYDSYARIIGNHHLTSYYEKHPPEKVDFNKLFSTAEVAKADKLFYKEPRERDFQNDFDKFMFKHLPKFTQQREFSSNHPGLGGQPQHSYTINVPQQDNILIFDSRFECGNLRRAIKVNNVEYNLWLENDVNTKGHTQWFYFKVKRPVMNHRQKIQFNILNLAKPQSLYSYGMKPCIFSKRQKQLNDRDWFRGGEDIKYFQNEIPRKTNNQHNGNSAGNNQFLYNNNGAGEGLEYYSTLSFIYEFEADEDEVWFAQAFPYSYSDLQKDLLTMNEKQHAKNIISVNILCKELAGSPVPMTTITDNVDTYLHYYDQFQLSKELPNVVRKQFHKKYMKSKKLYKQSLESKGKVRKLLRAAFEEELNSFYEGNADIFKAIDDNHNTNGESGIFGRRYDNFNNRLKQYIVDHFQKKAIIITSRVHPGEPQSSYMVKGMLDYLVSDEAAELRKHFVFIVIPMLNVDGVIYGNQRCSLLGVDLNRRWVSPNVFLHPTIHYAKQLIKHTRNERRVLLYCDLHGHSRKQNAFFYACNYKNYEHEGRIKNAQMRMMPLLCCHRSPNFYKFKDCRFRIEKCKESTARVVIFKDFNIMNAFTLEVSFFGQEPAEAPDEILPMDGVDERDGKSHSFANLQALIQKPQKGTHFSIQDLQIIGQTLPQILHNYLPKEQSKLEILSSKILEIFYEEFVKFIPPYMLKREEDKKRQLMGFEMQESESINQSQIVNAAIYPLPSGLQWYGRTPTVASRAPQQSSPRATNTGNMVQQTTSLNGAVLQQAAQNLNSQLGSISKVTRRQQTRQPAGLGDQLQTPSGTKKTIRVLNTLQSIQQSQTPNQAGLTQPLTVGPNAGTSQPAIGFVRKQTFGEKGAGTTGKKGKIKSKKDQQDKLGAGAYTGTETDTFSQIIKIHRNQEEVMDFEQFIKGVKMTEKKQHDSEEDVNGDEIDSSGDSDESSKNLIVEQTLQQQNHLARQLNKVLAQRKIAKKAFALQAKKKEEEDLFKSLDEAKARYKKQQQLAAAAQNAMKFKAGGVPGKGGLESRQNSKLANKTQSKNSKDGDLLFDKIPHRHSKSPRTKNNDINGDEIIDLEDGDEESKEDSPGSESGVLDQEKKDNMLTMYQSYEDLRIVSKTKSSAINQLQFDRHKPQQHVLPLYESAAYHQNRLSSINSNQGGGHKYQKNSSHAPSNNASILYQNVRAIGNPFAYNRNHQQRQQYDPYIDETSLINPPMRASGNHPKNGAPAGSANVPGFSSQQKGGVIFIRPSTQQEQSQGVGQFNSNVTKQHSGNNSSSPLKQPSYGQYQSCFPSQQQNPVVSNNKVTTRLKQNQYQTGTGSINAGGLLSNMGSMIQPIIANEIQELGRKLKLGGGITIRPTGQRIPGASLDQSTKNQSKANPVSQNVDSNNSGNVSVIQRISFKELLESSRQQRIQGISVGERGSQAARSRKQPNTFQQPSQVQNESTDKRPALSNYNDNAAKSKVAPLSVQTTHRDVTFKVHIIDQQNPVPNMVMVNKQEIIDKVLKGQYRSGVQGNQQQANGYFGGPKGSIIYAEGGGLQDDNLTPKMIVNPRETAAAARAIDFSAGSADKNTMFFNQRAQVSVTNTEQNQGGRKPAQAASVKHAA